MEQQQQERTEGMSLISIAFWTVTLVAMDIVIYGCLMPIIGTYIGAYLSCVLGGLSPYSEMLMVISIVFGLMFGVLKLKIEVTFWRHLFSQEAIFYMILVVREFANLATVIFHLSEIYKSMKIDSSTYGNAKAATIYEGIGIILKQNFAKVGIWKFPENQVVATTVDEPTGLNWISWIWEFVTKMLELAGWETFEKSPSHQTPTTLSDCEMLQRAQLLLAFGGLTAAMIKILYYNSLFSYLRALEIVASLGKLDSDYRISASTDSLPSNYVSDFSVYKESIKDRSGASKIKPVKNHSHFIVPAGPRLFSESQVIQVKPKK